jgi:hypothetical protein
MHNERPDLPICSPFMITLNTSKSTPGLVVWRIMSVPIPIKPVVKECNGGFTCLFSFEGEVSFSTRASGNLSHLCQFQEIHERKAFISTEVCAIGSVLFTKSGSISTRRSSNGCDAKHLKYTYILKFFGAHCHSLTIEIQGTCVDCL